MFQAVHRIWHRSWFRNEHLLNFLVNFFYFRTRVRLFRKNISNIYLFSNIILFILFVFVIVIPSRRPFLRDPSCGSTWIFAHTSSCRNILQQHVYLFCIMYSTYFLFPPYNIYSCAHIYHSCNTFPWFDVPITPSLIIFLRFYWTAYSFYCTWLIACPKFFR